jgi:hypothetical protein
MAEMRHFLDFGGELTEGTTLEYQATKIELSISVATGYY